MMIQEQKVVSNAAQDLIASLPVDGKLDVLNHLISELSSKDLGRLSAESRLLLLQRLQATANYVAPVAGPRDMVTTAKPASLDTPPHMLCNLTLKETELGREVSFVIRKGMSGRQILEAIEKENPRGAGEGVVSPHSAPFRECELDTIAISDTHVKLTVCFKFSNLFRNEQRERLAEQYLEFAPRWALALGAALYRDANGFPPDRSDIGTSRDAGDLFNGLWVRAAGSSTLTSAEIGLYDHFWVNDVCRNYKIVAAGSPISSQHT